MGLDRNDILSMLSKLNDNQKVLMSSSGDIFPVYGVILKDKLIEIQVGWSPMIGLRQSDMSEIITIKDFLMQIRALSLDGTSRVKCNIQSTLVPIKGIDPLHKYKAVTERFCVLLC